LLQDFEIFFHEVQFLIYFSIFSSDNYSHWVEEGIIINSIAVILVGLGLIIPFAVRRANSPANTKVYVTERL
jgi:hypothetical protein